MREKGGREAGVPTFPRETKEVSESQRERYLQDYKKPMVSSQR